VYTKSGCVEETCISTGARNSTLDAHTSNRLKATGERVNKRVSSDVTSDVRHDVEKNTSCRSWAGPGAASPSSCVGNASTPTPKTATNAAHVRRHCPHNTATIPANSRNVSTSPGTVTSAKTNNVTSSKAKVQFNGVDSYHVPKRPGKPHSHV
jgi:hypothetical protein